MTLSLSAQSRKEPLGFRLVQDYLIVVPVQINDTESFEFLLDTGTNTTIITPQAAGRLKLKPVDRIEVVTVAGSVTTPRSFLSRLMFGGNAVENTEVLWSDLPELRRLDNRISGVLGQTALARLNFTLDFQEQRINFGDTNDDPAAHVPYEIDDGQIVLRAKVGTEVCRFVLDSGVSDMIIFASGYQKLRNQIQWNNQAVQVSTNQGGQSARSGWLNRLQLGNKIFHRLRVASLGDTKRDSDGLLPIHLFRSVYFNNLEGYVILNP